MSGAAMSRRAVRNGTVVGGGLRAEIFTDATERQPRWWMWLPPFTPWRLFQFPYTVFLTEDRYPFGSIEGVATTLHGARRIARRGLDRRARFGPDYATVETLR